MVLFLSNKVVKKGHDGIPYDAAATGEVGGRITNPPLLQLTLQKGKHGLGSGVSLRQCGNAGLQQDLRLGEVSCLGCQARVADLRFSRSEVGQLRLRQVDSVVELVLTSADDGLRAAQCGDGISQCVYYRERTGLCGYIGRAASA